MATVLEEMPPFPEKEVGGLLNLLKKKRPGRVPESQENKTADEGSTPKSHAVILNQHDTSIGASADLLGNTINFYSHKFIFE